jgi:hypothetical protein
MSRFVLGLSALVAIAGLVGCGSSGPDLVIAKGKIVKGGNPLPITRPEIGVGSLQLQLTPEASAPGLEPEVTRAKEDGTFEFIGEGKGIKPGTYRLSVLHFQDGPPVDKLNGAFGPQNTPLKVTVAADKGPSHDLGTIDLDKP